MSTTERLQAPISFDCYIEQQRVRLGQFCRDYFLEVQVAINEGRPHCDFHIGDAMTIEFPWSLLASEIKLRFPEYETSIVTREYDPGECELHVEGYTVRIFVSKKKQAE